MGAKLYCIDCNNCKDIDGTLMCTAVLDIVTKEFVTCEKARKSTYWGDIDGEDNKMCGIAANRFVSK